MTAGITRVMSVVSTKLPERHPNAQMSLISCVMPCSPMTSPFSSHYQPAHGLSACRLSSSSSFPPRSQPSADCLLLWSPTPEENRSYQRQLGASESAQRSSSQEEARPKENGGPNCRLALRREAAVHLRNWRGCSVLTFASMRVYNKVTYGFVSSSLT